MRRKRLFLAAFTILSSFLILNLIPCDRVFAQDKTIVLKMANYFPPPSQQSKICEEFIADLEKQTNGKV
ncbi:MAG: hypothetical protein CVU57_29070, partial [Deltaproteobacteria bacterium HGW-Deltaproteobacteria-15]